MRKAVVKIEGRERVVEIDDGGRARVDGVDAGVEVIEAEPGMWLLRRGNEQTVAAVDGSGPKRTVEIRRPGADPLILAAELADLPGARARSAAPAASATAGGGPMIVRSPIPGRIAKVLVATDGVVAAGQTVVVLEAMKMENELRAPRAGRIGKVHCPEGATVEAGQDLVTIV